MAGTAFILGDEMNSQQQQLSGMPGKRSVDTLLSTTTNTNLADEALYRHYPPVSPNSSNSSAASSSDGSILDTPSAYTFEALNRKLASRWCSPPPRFSASCSLTQDAACNYNNAMNCLSDTASHACGSNAAHLSAVGSPATGGAKCGPACASQLLFLVRHGETDMNKAGRLQGRGVNAHLNDVGLDQAQGLGRFVRNIPFDTVTSSSLDRAHETAMRIAENNEMCLRRAQENGPASRAHAASTSCSTGKSSPLKEQAGERTTQADFCCGDKAQVRVRKMEGLDELSWGTLEGEDFNVEPFKGRLADLKKAWDDGIFSRAAEGGESLTEVEARSRAAVDAILDQGEDLNLVVSHGRTMRILLLSLTGLGMDQMTNMGKIPNCGTYILEARRSGPGGTRSYRLLPSCD